MLGNPELPGLHHFGVDCILATFQLINERNEHRAVLGCCEPLNVLEEYGPGSQMVGNREKAPPEVRPLVIRTAPAFFHQVTDLGRPRPIRPVGQ